MGVLARGVLIINTTRVIVGKKTLWTGVDRVSSQALSEREGEPT